MGSVCKGEFVREYTLQACRDFHLGKRLKKKGHIVDVPLFYRNNTGFDNPVYRYPLFSAGSCLWRHRCGWWCAGDLDHGTYHVSKYEYPCEVRKIDEIG